MDQSNDTIVRLREGTDVTLLAYGMMVNHVLEAAELLAERGISSEVLKLNRISPLDAETLGAFFKNTDCLLVAEDAFGAGCVGQRIAAILAEHGRLPKHLILKNLGKTFAPEGTVPQLEHRFGLDGQGIAEAVLEAGV